MPVAYLPRAKERNSIASLKERRQMGIPYGLDSNSLDWLTIEGTLSVTANMQCEPTMNGTLMLVKLLMRRIRQTTAPSSQRANNSLLSSADRTPAKGVEDLSRCPSSESSVMIVISSGVVFVSSRVSHSSKQRASADPA
jgi:hypothetical protein